MGTKIWGALAMSMSLWATNLALAADWSVVPSITQRLEYNSNFNTTPTVIALLPFLSSENDSSKIQFLNSIFTQRPHGPPDLYLLHSSYLL